MLRLEARLAAMLREPTHIQIPVAAAEAARGALNAAAFPREYGPLTPAHRAQLEALDEAIHSGFMNDVIGELNAPWRVRARLTRERIFG